MKLRHKYLLCAASLTSILLLIIGIAWTQAPGGASAQNAPVIAALDPNAIAAGSPGFILIVSGSHFMNGSAVHWNGEERATTLVNGTVLRARIPASDVAAEGTADVAVVNPSFSRISNIMTFHIAPVSSFQP